MRKFIALCYAIVCILVIIEWGYAAQSSVSIEAIRSSHSSTKTRFVFDLTGNRKPKIQHLHRPERIVLDFAHTTLSAKIDHLTLLDSVVHSVRYSNQGFKRKQLRIVLDCRQTVRIKSFLLEPNRTRGHRFVVDLITQAKQQKKVKRPSKVPVQKKIIGEKKHQHQGKKKLIMLDPGHGGADPGAIGVYSSIREKDIVLSIAIKIAAILKQRPEYSVRMTRKKDVYLSLRQRMKKARAVQADLFVSIHADSFKKAPALRGSSVYVLSEKGASSELARWVANRENAGRDQLIGRGEGIRLNDKSGILAGILLDLTQTSNIAASAALGRTILKAMGRVTRIHSKRLGEAAFMVLRSPDIPSVLIETGFISNKQDARALASTAHQMVLARAIVQGVDQYFKAAE